MSPATLEDRLMSIELTKVEMLEDLRVTVATIEQVHPDPFLHCGGRVAFFTAVHEIARSLPPLMSVADFGIEVGKVTALVGDGHTVAYGFDDADDDTVTFGVWFGVVAADLVLMRTHHDQLTSPSRPASEPRVGVRRPASHSRPLPPRSTRHRSSEQRHLADRPRRCCPRLPRTRRRRHRNPGHRTPVDGHSINSRRG